LLHQTINHKKGKSRQRGSALNRKVGQSEPEINSLAIARAVAGFKSAFAGARLIHLDEKQNFLLLTQFSLNFSGYGAC